MWCFADGLGDQCTRFRMDPPNALDDPADGVDRSGEEAEAACGSVQVVEFLIRYAGEVGDGVVLPRKTDDEGDLVKCLQNQSRPGRVVSNPPCSPWDWPSLARRLGQVSSRQ
jgi:hypothetical protein